MRPRQDDLREAALMETYELARGFERSKRRMLMLAAGKQPPIVERMLYFEDAMFKDVFDQ